MKILLINPYKTSGRDERTYPMEPLGLLSLATYVNREVKKQSLDVRLEILDAQMEGDESCLKVKEGYRSGLSDSQFKDRILQSKPDVVGITNNFTNGVSDVLDMIKLIKESHPNCILIVGGAHSTIAHRDIIKFPGVDIVVRGEGEETFKELVFSLYNKKNLREITGITYKEKGKIKINPDRELIKDINALPIPDRSLISYRKYLERTSETYFYTMNKFVGTLFSARGCPYRCVFCSTQKVWRNKWRSRNAENMLKEVEYLYREYGVREISFTDDQFIFDKNRIKEFCKLIIKKNLKVTFIVPSGVSPSLIDEETMRLMKKAGFYRVCFSIDAGTESAQKFIRKPVKLSDMRGLIKKANSIGLYTYATFVIGFPYEKHSDICETIKYAYGLKLDFVRFYIAQPHLGSDLYDILFKEGVLDKDTVESPHFLFESMFGTKHISSKELEKLRDTAEFGYFRHHLKHFFNPFYLIQEFMPKIFSFRKFAYFIGLLYNYRNAKM